MRKTKSPEKNLKVPPYPRHSLEKALRIPSGILEQNAGKVCTDEESATYVKLKYNRGHYNVEINSAIKFGLLERPTSGKIQLTPLARKIFKPLETNDRIAGLQEAVLTAPVISDVYSHYRGENLPDSNIFSNVLTEKFRIPDEKLDDFKNIFFETLKYAELITEHEGKFRVIDISAEPTAHEKTTETFKKLERTTKVKTGDTCFIYDAIC